MSLAPGLLLLSQHPVRHCHCHHRSRVSSALLVTAVRQREAFHPPLGIPPRGIEEYMIKSRSRGGLVCLPAHSTQDLARDVLLDQRVPERLDQRVRARSVEPLSGTASRRRVVVGRPSCVIPSITSPPFGRPSRCRASRDRCRSRSLCAWGGGGGPSLLPLPPLPPNALHTPRQGVGRQRLPEPGDCLNLGRVSGGPRARRRSPAIQIAGAYFCSRDIALPAMRPSG